MLALQHPNSTLDRYEIVVGLIVFAFYHLAPTITYGLHVVSVVDLVDPGARGLGGDNIAYRIWEVANGSNWNSHLNCDHSEGMILVWLR